jgi:hypothetical protein
MRRAALLLALLSLSACRMAGPEDTYRAFAAAARAGDAAEAWALLSEGSRARLEARAKALAARVPGTAASGRDLLLGDLSTGAPRLAKVTVKDQAGDGAVLVVAVEGGGDPAAPGEVSLVREGGQWRVVLPGIESSP